FGGGMSSRLFQEVRERRGLCYSIYSTYWALADSGLFAIHAATGPDMMAELIEVVAGELRRPAAASAAEADMARPQGRIKAGTLMGLEGSSAGAEYMARQLLLFDKLIDTKEIIARIEAVDAEAVRALAAGLVTASKPSITVVGAGRKGTTYAHMAERMVLDAAGHAG